MLLVQSAQRRLRQAEDLAKTSVTFDRLKTVLFLYVLLSYAIKAERHVWARGPVQTLRDLVQWISHRAVTLVLQLPSNRFKVETEMGKTRKDIEAKLVPSGAGVSRHLALPSKGQTPEWIAEEMEKMDVELEHRADYKDGKLSGAVYRTSFLVSFACPCPPPRRWWR
jgi:sphinganine-1-phosphate aldolase